MNNSQSPEVNNQLGKRAINEEAEELLRLRARKRRISQMLLQPTPMPSISLGGRSKKAPRVEPKLPTFLNEKRERLMDSLSLSEIEALQEAADVKTSIVFERIERVNRYQSK